MDCDKIWESEPDRVRVPSCDPLKKGELPNLTFFKPDVNEFDLYNKKNKK